MSASKVPEKTVTRLSIYLRCLEELEEDGLGAVSSKQLAERFGLNSAQVRKDLAYFGQFGVRGLGYYIVELKHNLERILGLKQEWEVALVGIGNLGSALAGYKGFQERGFKVVALFDRDPARIGKRLGNLAVLDAARMVSSIRRRKIRIAVISVPAQNAQAVADHLVQAGVTAILNFAPTQLSVPPDVKVQNVDLSILLKTLSFYTVRSNKAGPRRA